MTRGQMAAMLYNSRKPEDYVPPSTSYFADVSTENVFYRHISWMYAAGITNGKQSGGYGPWLPVTRGEMAIFLYKMAGSPEYTPPAPVPRS